MRAYIWTVFLLFNNLINVSKKIKLTPIVSFKENFHVESE